MILKMSQNSQENTCVAVFFNNAAGMKAPAFFLCEFCKIFKNTFITEHRVTAASVCFKFQFIIFVILCGQMFLDFNSFDLFND